MNLTPGIIARIEAIRPRMEAIDWFRHCGQPFDLPLSMEVRCISSWERAIMCYHDPDWEDTTLEIQNVLSGHLSLKYRAEFRQWNVIAEVGRGFLEARIEPKLIAFQERFGLDKAFLSTVRWDLLGAIIEEAYQHCEPPTNFCHELLMVYEAGHFPCGWDGGKWPRGWLIVF